MDGNAVDKLARKREPMPDNALMSDIMLYHSLTALYAEYRDGVVSKEIAKLEKKKLMEKHRDLELNERIYTEHSRRMVEISRVLVQANKEGCPICKQIAMVFDGRQREIRMFGYDDHKYSGPVDE